MFAVAIFLDFTTTETKQQKNSLNSSSIYFLSIGLENCLQLRVHIQMERMFANGQMHHKQRFAKSGSS